MAMLNYQRVLSCTFNLKETPAYKGPRHLPRQAQRHLRRVHGLRVRGAVRDVETA